MKTISLRDYGKVLFIIVLISFIYVSYKIVSPFIGDILAAIVLSIVSFPLYQKLKNKINRKNTAALITTLFIVLLITIPALFFANTLLHEAITIYNSIGAVDLHTPSEKLKEITGLNIEFDRYIKETIREASNLFIKSSTEIIRFLATGFVHLFATFFMMFFFLRDGKSIAREVRRSLPLSEYQKTRLFKGVTDKINGIFLGFLALGIAEFLAAFIGFSIAGIENALIWSLIVAIFAYIPILGPAAVWVPAAIYLFINGNVGQAIFLSIYFIIVLSFYMDNILRAQLIGKTAKIAPIISLLGIFGGIILFGIVGLIVGPLILSLFLLVYKLYMEEKDNANS
jgi:predicted PurR-regulated permease PerM